MLNCLKGDLNISSFLFLTFDLAFMLVTSNYEVLDFQLIDIFLFILILSGPHFTTAMFLFLF